MAAPCSRRLPDLVVHLPGVLEVGRHLGEPLVEGPQVLGQGLAGVLQVGLGQVAPLRGPLDPAALLVHLLGPRADLHQPELRLGLGDRRLLLGDPAVQVGDLEPDDRRPGRDPLALVEADLAEEPGHGGADLGPDGRPDLERPAGPVLRLDVEQGDGSPTIAQKPERRSNASAGIILRTSPFSTPRNCPRKVSHASGMTASATSPQDDQKYRNNATNMRPRKNRENSQDASP